MFYFLCFLPLHSFFSLVRLYFHDIQSKEKDKKYSFLVILLQRVFFKNKDTFKDINAHIPKISLLLLFHIITNLVLLLRLITAYITL